MTLMITTFNIMIFGITTLSIITFGITTLSITIKNHYAQHNDT
jgi:hypothetical protein